MELSLYTECIRSRTASRVFGVAAAVCLTMLGAFVRIPLWFTPVPLTLQTFFVLLTGACLGRRLGALSQIFYLLIGVAGLPVFSHAGSGALYLAGPTGGYLAGFIIASLFIGAAVPRAKTQAGVCALFCAASMLILCCGTLWLALAFGYPPLQAVYAGLVPFVPGDAVKALLASFLYFRIRKRCTELF